MVKTLPPHLIGVCISPDKDGKSQYILCGIRLLQTLCDLTPRNAKLEQVPSSYVFFMSFQRTGLLCVYGTVFRRIVFFFFCLHIVIGLA